MEMDGVEATRTWKRDGTLNVMDLEKAVLNLVANRAKPDDLSAPHAVKVFTEALLRGEALQTPLAIFTLRGIAP